MRLPVVTSPVHRGKLLEIDPERETVTVIAADGQILGRAAWHTVIEHIQANSSPVPAAPVRAYPRVSVSIPLRYREGDGPETESLASSIGEGGLFIECEKPLPPGTAIVVEFCLPDRPEQWVKAAASVAWVCERPDQYQFQPGMGVRFDDLTPEARERVRALAGRLVGEAADP